MILKKLLKSDSWTREAKQSNIRKKIKRLTAFHEAGHAIVSSQLETQKDIKEVSIIPRGVAGGYTMYKKQTRISTIFQKQKWKRN